MDWDSSVVIDGKAISVHEVTRVKLEFIVIFNTVDTITLL